MLLRLVRKGQGFCRFEFAGMYDDICILSNSLNQTGYMRNCCFQTSPDWRGYAARSVGICSQAAAFEQKAGQVFLQS